ncbi:MAG: ankyrin repeat domain-containing protein [Planctomycetaceae bacterium]|nr:ankyrin repeat domain-containing protein [Planctomycetaceae bacterium]
MNAGDRDDTAHDDGGTLLHQAVALDVHALANLLTSPEFDVNAKDNHGRTPLHLAVTEFMEIETIKLLVSYGANVNAIDKNGETPLHLVVRNQSIFSTEVARFLVSEGANIHARDNTGKTPLHTAAQESKFKVEFLVSQEANINAKDVNGCTPLHLAAHAKKIDVMSFLISVGANVHARDHRERTPLHWAARKTKRFVLLGEDVNAIKLLVLHGADVNAKNKNGKTPFDMAKEGGNMAITEYLAKQGGGRGIPCGSEFEENDTTDTVDLTNGNDLDCLNGDRKESPDHKTLTEIKSYLRQANRLINKALRKLEDR